MVIPLGITTTHTNVIQDFHREIQTHLSPFYEVVLLYTCPRWIVECSIEHTVAGYDYVKVANYANNVAKPIASIYSILTE